MAQSTISSNNTQGERSRGGGIYTVGDLTLTESTVHGNATAGFLSEGGGVAVGLGNLTIVDSTISGNSTSAVAATSSPVVESSLAVEPMSLRPGKQEDKTATKDTKDTKKL